MSAKSTFQTGLRCRAELAKLTRSAMRGDVTAAVELMRVAADATDAAHAAWVNLLPREWSTIAGADADRADSIQVLRRHLRSHNMPLPTLEPIWGLPAKGKRPEPSTPWLRRKIRRDIEQRQRAILNAVQYGPLKTVGRQTDTGGMAHLVFDIIEPAFLLIRRSKTSPVDRLEIEIRGLGRCVCAANYKDWVTLAIQWIEKHRSNELVQGSSLFRVARAESRLRSASARGKAKNPTSRRNEILRGLKDEMLRWLRVNLKGPTN